MKKAITTFLLTFLGITILFAQWELRDAIEFQPRNGLPNFFHKIKAKETVKVGFIGGSITEANGWRTKTISWLKEYYQIDNLVDYSAAIGGTDSKYGVFRINNQLLDKQDFDLIFIEFAVNDNNWISPRIERSMEGMVRKIWKNNPLTDICFVYTYSTGFFEDMENSKMNLTASIHDTVASYYGIPSIFWGIEVDKLLQSGNVVWYDKITNTNTSQNESGQYVFTLDNIHPTDYGHQIYARILSECFIKIDSVCSVTEHVLPPPKNDNNYENAQMLAATIPNNHGLEIIDRVGQASYLDKYINNETHFLVSGDTCAFYSCSFIGSEFGLHLLLGPNGGKYIIEIDGKKREFKSFNGYCSTWWKYYEFIELSSSGEHFVKIYPSPNPLSLSEKREILNTEAQKQDLDNNPEKYNKNELIFSDIFLDGEISNYFTDSVKLCSGDTLNWHQNQYYKSGKYYANYPKYNGYDSIYQLTLDFHTKYFSEINDTINAGDSILWEGNYYTEPGEYIIKYTSMEGCDSVCCLNLKTDKITDKSTTTSEYLFEESAGLSILDSKGPNDGSIINNAFRVEGFNGNGLYFDGSGYINLGQCFADNIKNEITLSAWIKPDVTEESYQGIIMHGSKNLDNFALYINPEFKKIIFRTRNTYPDVNQWIEVTKTELWDGNWHQITATYNGKQKVIYIDGIALKSVESTGEIESGAGYNLYIGAGRDVGFNKSLYMGFIDEVRIYNYGLTASEIQITNIENKLYGLENSIFKIYPNPTNNVVNVAYVITPDKGTKIEILDENGRIKHSQLALSETNRIETNKLIPGIYFIRSINKKNCLIKKLIIQ